MSIRECCCKFTAYSCLDCCCCRHFGSEQKLINAKRTDVSGGWGGEGISGFKLNFIVQHHQDIVALFSVSCLSLMYNDSIRASTQCRFNFNEITFFFRGLWKVFIFLFSSSLRAVPNKFYSRVVSAVSGWGSRDGEDKMRRDIVARSVQEEKRRTCVSWRM